MTNKILENKTLLFVIKFTVIFSVLHFLVWILPTQFLQNFIASLQGNLLNLPVKENLIFLGQQKILINPSCTGLISISILAAIIFSLRKPELKQKTKIFLLASIIMFFLNLARIYLVLWLGIKHGAELIGVMHEISWMSTALFIVWLWYYFTKKITKVKEFNELL
jgi:exosortase/archaeosortase family protein